MDFGSVARGDHVRNGTAPPPPLDFYGALSVASGGEPGWRIWAHNGGDAALGQLVKLERGFLVGAGARAKKAKLIEGLDVPLALVVVLKQRARPALESPSLLKKLAELHGQDAAEDAIQAAVRKLDEEGGASCVALREILGGDVKVRYTRHEGKIVFAVIDLIQAAKGCGYNTAKWHILQIARCFYNIDLDDSPEVGGISTHFWRIIFGGQGSRPTLCAAIEKAVEIVALIPGSGLAADIRRRCAETLVRLAGGDLSLIDNVIANRALQDYLAEKDPENPLLAAGEFAERGRKRSFDEMHGAAHGVVQVFSKELVEQRAALKSLAEAIQKIQESQASQASALTLATGEIAKVQESQASHASALALATGEIAKVQESQAATLAKVLASINGFAGQLALPVVVAVNRLEARLEARLLASITGALSGALASQTLSLCGHLRGVVDASLLAPGGAFVRALRDAVRPPARRASPRESSFPSGQKRGDAERALEPWINLTALVDRELRAERAARGLPADSLCYGTWRAERSRLGKALKRDRLRRHGLGPSHPDFCRRPLLWDRIAGGPAYVLHADEERHAARVLRSGAPSALDRLLLAPPSQDPWPLNRDDLVYGYDAGDE
jgi:hypothetical protein